MINLTELFEVQRKLDAEIERKHPAAPGEDRLAKRILALQVEMGELANEQRSWKFWSNDQEPRIKSYSWISMGEIKKSKIDPRGAVDNAIHFNGFTENNPLLEEYVDCLHFYLSIGLDLDLEDVYIYGFDSEDEDIDELFSSQMSMAFHLRKYSHPQKMEDLYSTMFSRFIGLGDMLGFTWEQIINAYMNKNKINWERQADGY